VQQRDLRPGCRPPYRCLQQDDSRSILCQRAATAPTSCTSLQPYGGSKLFLLRINGDFTPNREHLVNLPLQQAAHGQSADLTQTTRLCDPITPTP
jgi:hypothetical protein